MSTKMGTKIIAKAGTNYVRDPGMPQARPEQKMLSS